MRLLVLTSLHRCLDNIADALRQVRAEGGEIHLLLTPFLEDAGVAKLLAAECDTLHVEDFAGQTLFLWQQNFPIERLVARIVDLVARHGLDAVLMTDGLNFPWRDLRMYLNRRGVTVPVIVCQHGLVQPWTNGTLYKTCDFFFAFSEYHARLAEPTVTRRVLVSGLPKLDRLKGMERGAAKDDVLVLSSPMARTDHDYQQLIEGLSDAIKLPVYMRGHPMYPGNTSAAVPVIKIAHALALALDPMPAVLARIGLAVGAHSTSLLEAMVAGVPTVILPTRRHADAYPNHPCLAAALNVDAFRIAERVARHEPERTRAYLPTIIYDPDASHTEQFVRCLHEVIAA